MFGIGLEKLAVIMVVAAIVFGPDRLPDYARQAARLFRTLRAMADNARDEMRAELGPEFAELEFRDLDPRQIIRKHVAEALGEIEDAPTRVSEHQANRTAELPMGTAPPYDREAT